MEQRFDIGSAIEVAGMPPEEYVRQKKKSAREQILLIEGQKLAALHGAKVALDSGLIDFVYCETLEAVFRYIYFMWVACAFLDIYVLRSRSWRR